MSGVKSGKMQNTEREAQLDGTSPSDEGNGIEENLRTLNLMAPELTKELPVLFKNAVVYSIRNGMGGKAFGLVLESLPGIGPEHRPLVFRFLDSLYGDKAGDLEREIDRRFQLEVRQLLRKAKRVQAASLKVIDAAIRSL